MGKYETWETHPVYSNYKISDLGRVHGPRGVMKGWSNKDGYLMYDVRVGGKKFHRPVYQLVLETFVGACPGDEFDACHNDGDVTNNSLGNLRWDTKQNNQRDRLKHGTHVRGTRHPLCKLTDAQIAEIVEDPRRQVDIAREYGISQGHVSRIKCGHVREWLHD